MPPTCSASSPSVSRLIALYSTRNGLLNPFSFGTRCLSGIWPPSKPRGTVLRACWPLVPRPAVLPPLPPMPRPTRLRDLVEPGAGARSWTRMISSLRSVGVVVTSTRCGTRASMPRISGRSGRVFVLPMRPRPSARSVPRVFGLAWAPERIWVTLRSPLTIGAILGGGRVAALLAVVVGLEHALRHEVLGGQAAALGDLVGALQRLEAGDRGPGDVDVVGRAERLAQDVVHAGLLEDDAGGATGDDAGTGGGRLHQDAAGAGDAEHRVGDRAAGEGDVEQVALGLLGALLDGEGHLLGLAVAEPDTAVAVADHDERREREATATTHDLGDAVDRDDPRLAQAALVGLVACLVAEVCCCSCEYAMDQNSRPASRAAAASAAIRPW